MAELIAAFAFGVLYKEALGSWEHLRGPLLAALPIVGHLCNVGCRRVKNALGQVKNSSDHACAPPTLRVSRPKKRTFSDVSDLMKDLNQVSPKSSQVPPNSPKETVESPLPVLPGKRQVSSDESGPLKPLEPVTEPEVLSKIKDRSIENTNNISSAVQQELFHKEDSVPAEPEKEVPGQAIQLDLLLTNRRDNHENSLAEETLIPCSKPSNKFVADLELENTH